MELTALFRDSGSGDNSLLKSPPNFADEACNRLLIGQRASIIFPYTLTTFQLNMKVIFLINYFTISVNSFEVRLKYKVHHNNFKIY